MNRLSLKRFLLFVSLISYCALTFAQPRILQNAHDSAITLQVKSALAADPITKSRHIHVTTRRGNVTLSGAIDSYAEAHAAKQVAESIPGVRSVSLRDISVKHSQRANLDAYITKNVLRRLKDYRLIDNPHFPNLWVDVETRNANVYLTGNIIYPYQGKRAVEIARYTDGVEKVYYNFTTMGQSKP